MATNQTENKLTHWRKIDFRQDSLYQIITGLENSINSFKQKVEERDCYDSICFCEDTEHIYGLAFIAFQNYIYGSINDLYRIITTPEGDEKIVKVDYIKYCKIESNLTCFNKSSIELIVGLANFIKHRDEGKLQKGTMDILDCFNLIYFPDDINDELIKSPIFEGLSLLNEEWDLFEILKIVINWRKKLFDDFSENCRREEEKKVQFI